MSRARTYEGKSISITYDVARCIHAAECTRRLPAVFDPDAKPWVNPDAATAHEIAQMISHCPTGALKYERKDGGPQESAPTTNTVTIGQDGPLYVHGDVLIKSPTGEELVRDTRVAVCRCGASKIKPLCDGSHLDAGFADEGAVGKGPRVDTLPEAHGTLEITAVPNGPLLVSGHLTLHAADGTTSHHTKGAWCRCGGSANKPFCDGTHKKNGFSSDNP